MLNDDIGASPGRFAANSRMASRPPADDPTPITRDSFCRFFLVSSLEDSDVFAIKPLIKWNLFDDFGIILTQYLTNLEPAADFVSPNSKRYVFVNLLLIFVS